MLGVFSVGRIINPVTARSQFIGGMTMGIGMALHEHGVMDPRFGTIVNHDFADYHIPTCADIEDMDAIWLEEPEAPRRTWESRIGRDRHCRRSSRDRKCRLPRDGRPAAEPSADPGRAPVLSLTGLGFRAPRAPGSRSVRGSVCDTRSPAGTSLWPVGLRHVSQSRRTTVCGTPADTGGLSL